MAWNQQSRWWIALPACTLAFLVWTVHPPSHAPSPSSQSSRSQTVEVEDAYHQHLSGVTVEATGAVERLLPDDTDGTRHQRFILHLALGLSVLVVHNIDVAQRVPVSPKDIVTVHGEYAYNEKGGAIHWTHHDPDGRKVGGWIRFESREYR